MSYEPQCDQCVASKFACDRHMTTFEMNDTADRAQPTAQLDVEALVGLLGQATAQSPLPWAVKESNGEYDEAWCPWYDLGPLSLPGEKPDAVGQLMIAAVNALPALLAHIAGEDARVAAAVAGVWIAPKTIDDMPAKPGLARYEYVESLILHKGELLSRPWNCEHKVFDDEEQDDYFCDWDAITAYRVIGHERDAAKSAAIRETPRA